MTTKQGHHSIRQVTVHTVLSNSSADYARSAHHAHSDNPTPMNRANVRQMTAVHLELS